MNFLLPALLLFVFSGNVFAQKEEEQEEKKAYTFDPRKTLRDPFSPTPELYGLQTANDILKIEVLQLKLIAVLSGLGAPQAMLQAPSGSVYIVQVGDRVGRRNGKVVKIKSQEIHVRESFIDNRGESKTNVITLMLAE